MTKKEKLFSTPDINSMGGVKYKSFLLKRHIIFELAKNGDLTISDLALKLNVSNPTITKLIGELISDGFLREVGKVETAGGRRPYTYGLIDNAGYFIGVDVANETLNMQIIDINQNQIAIELNVPFNMKNDYSSIDKLTNEINNIITKNKIVKDKIMGVGISFRGRVDSNLGEAYNIFDFDTNPIAEVITDKIGIKTIIENDTRAMAYAEWVATDKQGVKNALFVNIGQGVGVGIIIDSKLYYGKSGFSGEFGHTPFFDNQIICGCGKKGCLETEVSGSALERAFAESMENGASSILSEKYKKDKHISLNDIVNAATNDDMLSIELINNVGEKLGRGIGVLLNIFNPELVVIGGALSVAGDYLMLPIRTALNKYSLSLVNKDSHLRSSVLGESSGVTGAALLARNKILQENL